MKRSSSVWQELQPVLQAFFRAQPGLMGWGAVLSVLTVLMGMGLLGLSGWFITATALAGLNSTTAILFDVFMPSAGIRLLALGRTLSRYGERLVTHDATLAVVAGLREQLFRGWAQPEAARQLLLRPARLLFRLTVDMDALEAVYLRLLVPLAATLGAVLLASVVLGSLQGCWGVVLALWLLVTGAVIVLWLARKAIVPAARRGLATEALRAHTVDLLAGQTELAMVGRLTAQCDLLARADQRLARADDTLNRLEVTAGAAHSVVGTLTLVAVLLGVGALVGEGAIGAPLAALALLVVLTVTEPFAALRRGALESGRTWLAVRRLAPRMNAAPEPVVVPRADTHGNAAAIALHGVTYAHPGSTLPVFDALSLQIAAGERVALVGASGAGKSTLLALVAGELQPHSGTVQAQPCSWLTQRTELFQDTLADNLRLAQPTASDARLWQVLQDAGLQTDVQALAAGLQTPLGEGGLGLSGGQSRRLALARLLLRDVPVWLLDEPTEALDAATAQDVLQRLAQHADGRSLLIATHLRREAALADRLVCLQAGQIVADVRRGSAEFEAVLHTLRAD